MRFYSPIQETPDYADISFYMAMADCCVQLGEVKEAEACYLLVADSDARNMASRVELAKLYESIGNSEQALKYVNEAVLIGRQETRTRRRRKDTRLEQLVDEFKQAEGEALPIAPRPSALTTWQPSPLARERPEEAIRTQNVQFLYTKMKQLEPQVKEGVYEAIEDWLDIVDALLREFRSNRIFYPMARTMEFQGYSSEARRKAGRPKSYTIMDEMQEMAGRLQKSLGGRSTGTPISAPS